MDKEDRQRIDILCEEIALKTDMIKLWPNLLENRIFNLDDHNIPIWENNFNDHETKKNIISCIKTRGPYAFRNFVASLQQSGYADLSAKLKDLEINSNNQYQKKISSQMNAVALTESSDSYTEDEDESPHGFISKNTPLQIKVRKSKRFHDTPVKEKNALELYRMRSKPRGKVLIVCIIEYYNYSLVFDTRNGAIHDRNNLKELFEKMGFEVTITPEELRGDDLRKYVQDFAREDFREVDSCFVIFSCHGTQSAKHFDAEIAASDYRPKNSPYRRIYCNEIVEYFGSKNCEQLKGKPKVFIFQMCRGTKGQISVPRFTGNEPNARSSARLESDGVVNVQPAYTAEEVEVNKSRNSDDSDSLTEEVDDEPEFHKHYEDTLIVYATVPGYHSHRDLITGTWLIQVLCKVFMREAHEKHLRDLFRRVDAIIQHMEHKPKCCQTVMVNGSGFYKHCFINPGYFGEAP